MEINCDFCNNKGYYYKDILQPNGLIYKTSINCVCVPKREYVARAKQLALGEDIFNKTFDSFIITSAWQKHMIEKAIAFSNQNIHKSFYVGGQVGAGKTHTCTALLNKYLNKGMTCNYVVWNKVTTQLKQWAYEDKKAYYKLMDELINTQVLYIDDFFKTEQKKADIDNAFEIINTRYLKAKTENIITIFSSEKTLNQLIGIDEAIASRIYELAGKGEYTLAISKSQDKNYRYKKQ